MLSLQSTTSHNSSIKVGGQIRLENEIKRCFPACDSFRCGQRALSYSGQRVSCRWADDECSGPTCNYAICIREKMLTGGVCGLNVRRRTEEAETPQAASETRIRLKGKLARRFKEDELL